MAATFYEEIKRELLLLSSFIKIKTIVKMQHASQFNLTLDLDT
jgi:hypothetical protein